MSVGVGLPHYTSPSSNGGQIGFFFITTRVTLPPADPPTPKVWVNEGGGEPPPHSTSPETVEHPSGVNLGWEQPLCPWARVGDHVNTMGSHVAPISHPPRLFSTLVGKTWQAYSFHFFLLHALPDQWQGPSFYF